MEEYIKVFEDFWKELVCDADGNLILDNVMRELYDYHTALENVPKVYMHVSGGWLSKINYKPEGVINRADEVRDKFAREIIKEFIKGMEEEEIINPEQQQAMEAKISDYI